MRKRLLASFLCLCLLVCLLPTMALAEEPVELDISNGSIIITETGYSQGEESYNWTDGTPHALTITQADAAAPSSNYNEVQSGTVEITLQGVNLANGTRSPFLVGGSGTEATVVLEGQNTLVSNNARYAALQIGLNSTVTIQVPDGKPDGYGFLTADGGENSAGIGGSHSANAGKLHIKSGTIIAYGNKGYSTGIGTGRSNGNNYMEEIKISGGHVTNTGTTHFLGGGQGATKSISISGGYIVANGVGRVNAGKASTENLSISGGTIVTSSTPGLIAKNICCFFFLFFHLFYCYVYSYFDWYFFFYFFIQTVWHYEIVFISKKAQFVFTVKILYALFYFITINLSITIVHHTVYNFRTIPA